MASATDQIGRVRQRSGSALISVMSVAIYVALTVAVFALLGAIQKWVEAL